MISFLKKATHPTQSQKELVEEIHETFQTEVDRLLEEAGICYSTETDKQHIISKSERLQKLGFCNTKETQEAREEENRLKIIKHTNKKNKELVEAINYFSQKYPQYKFITEESVKKICDKYGLVYGEVSNYKGDVPDKNLKEIENFKIDKNDELYIHDRWFTDNSGRRYDYGVFNITYEQHLDLINSKKESEKIRSIPIFKSNYENDEYIGKASLEIAAPAKDFDLTGMKITDFKVSKIVEDPVVLAPVLYKGNKYYLIVSCWGAEASDELVVNEKMN